MPRTASFLLALIVVLLVGASIPGSGVSGSPAFDMSAPEAGAFAPGRVLVRWRQGIDPAQIIEPAKARGWAVERTLSPLSAAVLAVPEGEELAAIAALKADPRVLSAEPDVRAYATASGRHSAATPGRQPNDAHWVDQWAARRVQAPAAWTVSSGLPATIVAIIDSGIDLNHPEFSGRIRPGYDFVNNDNDPQDDYGHGTHVAGIIAAAGDNDLGVAGLSWQTLILPYKALDNTGGGWASDIAAAVLTADEAGASIINLSLGLTGPSDTLHAALRMAYQDGAIIIAASGNDGASAVSYPAAYPEVIAVAASTHGDDWAGYSNRGPEIDLAAPGGEADDLIISTSLNHGYGEMYGTSIAAPHVSGLAALMLAVAPSASNVTIAGALRNTADKVGSYAYTNGRNDRLGYGRVNAGKALRQVMQPELRPEPDHLQLLAGVGGTLPSAQVVLSNPSSQPLSWQLTEISGDWLDIDAPWNGALAYPTERTLNIQVISQLPAGAYTATIRIQTTTLGGLAEEIVLPVRLHVAAQIRQHFLPAIEHENLAVGWVDASSGGTRFDLADDGIQIVDLPFIFPYYGVEYDYFWLQANGFISFGQSYPGSQYAVNDCIPSLTPPDGAIYGLWTDLDPSAGGAIYTRDMQSDYFVIEWRDLPGFGSNDPNTFQVILWPDGRVLLQYQAVASPAAVTVGLENWDNTMGVQAACNGAGALPAAGQRLYYDTALP